MKSNKINRRKELMQTTVQIVAEIGLTNFSMKKVTEQAGVSEALIYKYFGTKERLLFDCFIDIHRKIESIFEGYPKPPLTSPDDLYHMCEMLWMTYFKFLVKGRAYTIYYFEYRDSPYINKIQDLAEENHVDNFKNFSQMILESPIYKEALQSIGSDCLRTYFLDTSGIFAKRIIRGELPDTEYTYKTIWRLLSNGLFGLLEIKS